MSAPDQAVSQVNAEVVPQSPAPQPQRHPHTEGPWAVTSGWCRWVA